MMRLSIIIPLLLLSATSAAAQPPRTATTSAGGDASCPRGRLSIYYASGEANVSQQAEALIGLISEHAIACKADGLDLIARIDSRVDGEGALSLALQRLNDVASELVARGVAVDRIRVAAQAAPSQAGSNINAIDVLFREAESPGNIVASDGNIERAPPSESI